MKKTPDYTALARDYLNLMQQQMAGAMTHPQFIESMLAALKTMDPRKHSHAGAKRHTSPAPATGDDALIRLERRIAKLERELASALRTVEQLSAAAQNTTRAVGRRAATASKRSAKRAAPTKAKAPVKAKPRPRKR